MKHFRSLSLPIVMILGLGSASYSLQAQETPRNAIIIVRHAEDAEKGVGKTEPSFAGKPDAKPAVDPWPSADWKGVAPDWPKYLYPFILIDKSGEPTAVNDSGFEIFAHALSGNWQTAGGIKGTKMKGGKEGPLGEKQALTLGNNLDSFLTQGKFAGIKRAITMDPREEGSTPNPFDTLWPYLNLKGTNQIDLYLVKRKAGDDKSPGMIAMLEKKKILPPEGGSTIICWTGEGLQDTPKVDKNGTEAHGDRRGILARLLEEYRDGKTYDTWVNGPIARCADIFVFYYDAANRGVAEKWLMDKDGKFTLVEKHPAD